MKNVKHCPSERIQNIQQKIRFAIQQATSTGMKERDLVEMTQRIFHDERGGKQK